MDGQITDFIKHHYRHFNAAALIDAAEAYKRHLYTGGKMMITLAGAMSTAELGLSLAEMINQSAQVRIRPPNQALHLTGGAHRLFQVDSSLSPASR